MWAAKVLVIQHIHPAQIDTWHNDKKQCVQYK